MSTICIQILSIATCQYFVFFLFYLYIYLSTYIGCCIYYKTGFFYRCAALLGFGSYSCNLFGCNCDEECRPVCGEDKKRKRSADDEDDDNPISKFSTLDIDADGLISFDEAHSHFTLQKRETEVMNDL